jgi:hypothetical protein
MPTQPCPSQQRLPFWRQHSCQIVTNRSPWATKVNRRGSAPATCAAGSPLVLLRVATCSHLCRGLRTFQMACRSAASSRPRSPSTTTSSRRRSSCRIRGLSRAPHLATSCG